VGQERSSARTQATERKMGLSVVVFVQLVITLLPYRFHEAANQFFCLHQETRDVLVEVDDARKTAGLMSSGLHQPASHLDQNRKPSPCKDLALGGHRRLWPLLHVGLSSARWLLSKPPKLWAKAGGDQKTPTQSAISNCNTHDR
jgi:hypothetical protein